MSARFMEMQKTLRARWKPGWQSQPAFAALEQAFSAAMTAVGELCKHSEALRSSGRYSDQGRMEEVRLYVRKETVPALRKAVAAIERTRAEVVAQRDKLAIPKADPADLVGALTRAEMRSWLKSMRMPEVLQTLTADNVDDRLLLAALEVPPAMAGLNEQMRQHLQTHLLEKHHGPELVRLRELEEAAELTNSAVDIGLYQLRQEADFPENSPSAFDAWMREGTGEIERGSASGSSGGEKPISATTSETVDAGPSVQEIVDEVFARALPQLYPDHPVNRGLPNRAA